MKTSIKNEFIKACEEHADALFRYGLYKTSDREVAKDLVQDTYIKTWSFIAKGEIVENYKLFFYRTLSNLIIDEYRKKKTFSLDALSEAGFEIPVDERSRVEQKLDGEIAIKMLEQIPEMYRDILYMKFVEDMSTHEIAIALGESENSISVKIHRGIKKITAIFNK